MVFSGLSPDGRLVEIAEMADHPFMVGTSSIRNFSRARTARTRCSWRFVQAVCERAGVESRRVKGRTLA